MSISSSYGALSLFSCLAASQPRPPPVASVVSSAATNATCRSMSAIPSSGGTPRHPRPSGAPPAAASASPAASLPLQSRTLAAAPDDTSAGCAESRSGMYGYARAV